MPCQPFVALPHEHLDANYISTKLSAKKKKKRKGKGKK
jgi:hypothetical protein